MGCRKIKLTVCNVPVGFPENLLASFLSTYRKVEEVNPIHDNAGIENRDYFSPVCLKRKGFREIPDTINYEGRQMIVIVEGW